MKLRLWISECVHDSPAFSVIGKTKKGVIEQLEKQGQENNYYEEEYTSDYSEMYQVEIEYQDGFDLFDMVSYCGRSPHNWAYDIISHYQNIRGEGWKKVKNSEWVK